jgi:cytochrome c-type biogenesis protein CcmE
MNPKRRKLLFTVIFIVLGTSTAVGLALMAFNENLLYFYSPLQVKRGEAPDNRAFRLGGLVVTGTVDRDPDSLVVEFDVTDTVEMMTIAYDGILPDLFREGQGIVANGSLDENGIFQADEVLAKHDENYMPPEVAQAISDAGGVVPTDHLTEEQP